MKFFLTLSLLLSACLVASAQQYNKTSQSSDEPSRIKEDLPTTSKSKKSTPHDPKKMSRQNTKVLNNHPTKLNSEKMRTVKSDHLVKLDDSTYVISNNFGEVKKYISEHRKEIAASGTSLYTANVIAFKSTKKQLASTFYTKSLGKLSMRRSLTLADKVRKIAHNKSMGTISIAVAAGSFIVSLSSPDKGDATKARNRINRK